jgi:hypothetical protein
MTVAVRERSGPTSAGASRPAASANATSQNARVDPAPAISPAEGRRRRVMAACPIARSIPSAVGSLDRDDRERKLRRATHFVELTVDHE